MTKSWEFPPATDTPPRRPGFTVREELLSGHRYGPYFRTARWARRWGRAYEWARRRPGGLAPALLLTAVHHDDWVAHRARNAPCPSAECRITRI